MSNKKFYWLKFKYDFFNQREIKKLRMIPGGDTYLIIYLKLQLLSLETNGDLIFEETENSIFEQLALELDESIESLTTTLKFLQDNRLIEFGKNQNISLNQTKELIGVETASTIRSRKSREKKKILAEITQEKSNNSCIATPMQQKCSTDIDIELDIDLEIDNKSKNNIDNSISVISLDYIEEIFRNFKLVSNPIEFHDYWSEQNWKFTNGNPVTKKALNALVKNWESKELEFQNGTNSQVDTKNVSNGNFDAGITI